MASIEVNGISAEVPEGSSVKDALVALGFEITMFPSDEGLFMPCQTGGCLSCAVDVDGELQRACVSKVHEGMRIRTNPGDLTPRRIVGGFMGHHVGGVGTP
jgi:pyruvate formate lyase activating enzyme